MVPGEILSHLNEPFKSLTGKLVFREDLPGSDVQGELEWVGAVCMCVCAHWGVG